ncbi:MAG: Ribosomal protein S6 modification protein 2 [Candidatus Uhrbacteria bacterium GW2011_GWD2_41_121]|uniref:Alpha-L-glutamate ligases, RimK family protein, ribosomal protein S6 modification protein n=1 Tax=Candidatus Uhrbacteria bacterium GW2011_GWC1_41_20 TaxID=1618983 RepID=A0A0G0XQ77_9BACT|nr:MAG: Ribosomal protein S6 modification protein 2 [Candidatus Uhrbacteria bacterium GW2011_GWE1_39_46]KKR63490.1 MAG: Ribosomal protein S6 modification protein 2 [Candidatus Uhrbacteria bacterium GW2011_GWC2_40_450]KKR89704.1 MAG: Ribosomal protein S6 modification protein 2 [Candidatus Uhrbacteria bacterium GW2011_GWD2_41_121]KKR95862.1 MAG: Ribosomal protein S6 modification protein 2 [Candidatus Uhrbacteria bacterium GW2011_GWD1_41_16]KKR98995.1 MAG: alpha-L-glutamate ligases, RimK family pr
MRIGILSFVAGPKKLAIGTKRIIREAKSRGHKVKVFYSPYVGLEFGNGKKITYQGIAIDPKKYDVIVVRPGFTQDPSINASIIKQFQLAGFYVLNGYIGVFRAKNKIRTLQMLDHFGVPVPKTLVVRDPQLLAQASEEFLFPVIIKVIFGTHGKGVFIAESKRSLKPIVEYLIAKEKGPVSLQEYIQEAKGCDLRVFVLGKKVVATMMRVAKSGEFRANFHQGGSVQVADLSDEEKRIAIKASQVMGLDISGVDILRTHKGPKVIEVNSNPGIEGISKGSGVDVAAKIVTFIEHRVEKYGVRRKRPLPKRLMKE